MQFQLLFRMPEWQIFILSSVFAVLFFEIFFRKGQWMAKHKNNLAQKVTDLLPNSLLMLLALFFGFSLSMSISRFDNRKTLVLKEANTIGTTYLRTDLFGEPYSKDLKSALLNYLQHRVQFYTAQYDMEQVQIYSQKTNQLHADIWSLSMAAVKSDNKPIYSTYVTSLNEMIDLDADRKHHSLTDHVPEPVYYLILMFIFISVGSLGYVHGCRGNRRFTGVLLSVLFSMVLTIIMDLDRPRRGLIRVPEDSMFQLQESLMK